MGRDDMYDDVDAFMDERHNKVSLGGRGGAADDDDEDEEDLLMAPRGKKGKKQQPRANVFELEGVEPDEDEDEEDEDDAAAVPSYFDVEKAEERAARARELASEANISTGWGKNRSTYYSADTQDFEIESDEEVAAAEESEARRLQQEHHQTLAQQVEAIDDIMAQVASAEADTAAATGGAAVAEADGKKGKKKKERSDAELLKDMDDELDNIDMALELDLDIAALTGDADAVPAPSATKGGKSSRAGAGSSGVSVEKITKDLSRLSEQDKLDMLLTSSPELLAMLDDYKAHMTQLHNLLPAWEEMKDNPEEYDKALVSFQPVCGDHCTAVWQKRLMAEPQEILTYICRWCHCCLLRAVLFRVHESEHVVVVPVACVVLPFPQGRRSWCASVFSSRHESAAGAPQQD
jgi:hypothetical protein